MNFVSIPNRIYQDQTSKDHIACPICRVKTIKSYTNLPKSRHILQYLDSLTLESDSNQKNAKQASSPSSSSSTWDKYKYMETIWNGINHKNAASLTESELNEALKNGFPDSELDKKKLKNIFSKYDKDLDKQIDFDEFCCLFTEINEKYDDFLVDVNANLEDSASNISPVNQEETDDTDDESV